VLVLVLVLVIVIVIVIDDHIQSFEDEDDWDRTFKNCCKALFYQTSFKSYKTRLLRML